MPLPKSELVPQAFGKISRDRLSLIFAEFIDANKFIVGQTGTFVPSVYLVFSPVEGGSEVIFPLNVSFLRPDQIDPVLLSVVKAFPREKYTLELMVYSAEVADERYIHPRTMVMFGARDLGGAIIHCDYMKVMQEGNKATIEPNDVDKSANMWIPALKKGAPMLPSGISPRGDPFLKFLTERYAMASSMSNLFNHQAPSTSIPLTGT